MNPFREWLLSDRYEQHGCRLGEWPTQFNDERPTGDDLHPYETRGAATFLPLIVEHRPHTRSGWAPTNTASMKPRGYSVVEFEAL